MWKNILHNVNELISEIVTASDANDDKVGMICKIMDIKDNILNQIYSGMLYRKIVIWIDLNITSDKYEAEKVVFLHNLVNQKRAEKSYVPTKLAFETFEIDYQGFYSKNVANVSSETT